MTETHISTRNDRRRGSVGVAALSLAAGTMLGIAGTVLATADAGAADVADSRPAPGCGPAVVARRWERVRLPAAARRRGGTLRGGPSRTSVPLAVSRRRRALRGRQSRIGLTQPPSSSRLARSTSSVSTHMGSDPHLAADGRERSRPSGLVGARTLLSCLRRSSDVLGRRSRSSPCAGRHSRTVSRWSRWWSATRDRGSPGSSPRSPARSMSRTQS